MQMEMATMELAVEAGEAKSPELSFSGSGSGSDGVTSLTSFNAEVLSTVGRGDIETWLPEHVQYWLSAIGLAHYYPILADNGWNAGDKLIKVTQSKLFEYSKIYFKNANDAPPETQIDFDCARLMRDIQNYQINEFVEEEEEGITVDDIAEFERRLTQYATKWERIEWIKEYVDDWDGRLPTTEVLEEELDVPNHVASDLLSAFQQKEKEEEIDLNKLFEGFGIAEHGVVWWSICLEKLVLQSQDSLWTILRYVLRELSTTVCIRLLNHFKFELLRFSSIEVDRLCQSIVYGSLYPMCTAIRLSGYLNDAAERDLSRSHEFFGLANDYAKLGVHLLDEYTDSDHLAAILLEMASDIDGLSAIDLAVKYQVIAFVSDKRIERISSTLFRTWRFLHIANKDESFKLRPLTISEFYDLFKKRAFFMTPLGQFCIETMLFVVYLGVFTWVTSGQISIYQPFDTWSEIIFWVLNIGYMIYECFDIWMSGGFSRYISDWTNQFDFLIVSEFAVMMAIRFYHAFGEIYPQCFALNHQSGAADVKSIPSYVFFAPLDLQEIPEDALPIDTDELCDIYQFTYKGELWAPQGCVGPQYGVSATDHLMDRCVPSNCCQDTAFNLVFSVLWIVAVLCLWFRVFQILTMSRNIGPFINMIINMLKNFSYFFVILAVFWIGVVMSLVFIAGDTVQYEGVWLSAITTWRALLGEWPAVDLQGTVSDARFNLVNVLNVYWMLFAAIILLNLLIALMTKSFDDLHEKNAMQVQFLQIERIYGLDAKICVMPPPLFLVVLVLFFVFKFVDLLTAVVLQYPLPISLLMPAWLVREGKETNLVGTLEEEYQEDNVNKRLKERKFSGCFGRCRKAYFIVNQQNQQQFDWQCKFCRQRTIVDYSKVRDATSSMKNNHDAVQRLGDQLGLDQPEVFNVRRLQPVLCQKCFRHRGTISRLAMQMEFISYWVFQICIKWWCLALLFVLNKIVNLFKTSAHSQLSVSDNVSRSEIASQAVCTYSRDVINKMPKTKEIRDLFKDNEIIWYLMDKSRFELTPRTFRRIVDSEILKRAHDRDYEIHEFYHKICGHHATLGPIQRGVQRGKQSKHARQRQKELGLAAKWWFLYIMDSCSTKIHLSHTKLFPFSAKGIEAHIESTLNERGKVASSISTTDIQEFLPMLYVTDPAEQEIVISSVREFGSNTMTLWQRLVQFLRETRRLLAYVRRIENMIRDVEDAIKAHGQDAEIYLSQFHLVFEDIQDDGIATVIFRSIDQERQSIPYWKVRYFFIALKQMRRNIDRELLEKSRYSQVTQGEFMNVVLKRVKAIDDDSDDDDDEEDDNLRSDTQAAKRMIAGIRTEAQLLFDRIQQQNRLKVTLTQVRDTMVISLVPELRIFDVTSFMQRKLERYIQQKQFRNRELTVSLLGDILSVDEEKVDKDEIPQITSLNEVVSTLQKVYDFCEDASRPVCTVRDAYNLVSVAFAMNHRVRNEVKSRGHDLELTQELFCKTMERKIMSQPANAAGGEEQKYDYSKPFDEWTDVARHSASVFQQVLDEEQNKVTLGQVRETLRGIYSDFRILCRNMQKLKRKLDSKKKLDEMVDFERFWRFLVHEMGVRDDSVGDTMVGKKHSMISGMGDEDAAGEDDGEEEKDGLLKRRKGKLPKKLVTSFKRANELFDLMEDHNGLWLTMRQIHVFLVFCVKMFQSTDVDWAAYQNDTSTVSEKEFLQIVLEKLEPLTLDDAASQTEIKLATYVHSTQATEDLNAQLQSGQHTEDPLSINELRRLLEMWNGEEKKYFEKQLKWIYSRSADGADTATWQGICRFSQRFRDGFIEQRVLQDLQYLSGNHEVYRDEFEQFKSVMHCRGEVAISLFYEIRYFAESINWNQMLEFVHFLETNIRTCREAIDKEVFGEDFDPTLEEMIAAMNISSEVDGKWLFDTVLKGHSDKVSWIEIREYLIDWNETRDEVTDYFEELTEKRDRDKLTEKTLEDITSKLGKIKTYFDSNVSVSKDELSRKSKEELVEFIVRSNWFNAAKQGFNMSQTLKPQQSSLTPQQSITLDENERKHKTSFMKKVISLV